jgi:hypothetical protein
MKRLVAAVIACAALVTGADYLGLMGESQMDMADVLNLRVRPVDQKSGQIVTDVHITCARDGSEEICSQKDQTGDGVITVNFLVKKSVKLSRLFKFKRKEKIWLDEEAAMALVFIQPNYDRYFLVLKGADLIEWADKVKEVALVPSSAGKS